MTSKKAAPGKAASKKQPATTRKAPTAARARKARKPYHHGALREALVGEALRLAEEGGVDAVNIREAARRAGVSPAAPFRHFANRAALMTAVAEEAQRRFRAEIDQAMKGCTGLEPLQQLRAFGRAYLRWAMRNPMHFEVISSNRLFNYDEASGLLQDNAQLIAMLDGLLAKAAQSGETKGGDIKAMRIAARALVYGFARMALDGHFPRWGVAKGEEERLADAVLDVLIAGIAQKT